MIAIYPDPLFAGIATITSFIRPSVEIICFLGNDLFGCNLAYNEKNPNRQVKEKQIPSPYNCSMSPRGEYRPFNIVPI
jgi:hypothetical protein